MIAGQKVAAAIPSLQMVDVVFDTETHGCKEYSNGHEFAATEDFVAEKHTPLEWHMDSATQEVEQSVKPQGTHAISPKTQRYPLLMTQSHEHNNSLDSRRSISFTAGEHESQPHVAFQTPISAHSLPMIQENDLLDFSMPELEPLDYLTDRDPLTFGDSLWPPIDENTLMDLDHVPAESPDMYAMYYPNATYRELHTTLYNHMVDTARGTGLTRTGTPESDKSQTDAPAHDPIRRTSQWEHSEPERCKPSNLPKGMSVRREMELWRNYLDEIALWLDMFDNDRHFQVQLPILARGSESLRLSILALSARQIERRDPDKPYTESLALYQEAIRLIANELETSPKDWSRHLNGAAMLLKAAGINGVVGGTRQAIFWCFARMAISRFKTDFQNFDNYANYSLFLCASVLNVVSSRGTSAERGSSYSAKWKALFDLLVDWHAKRPAEMRPLTPRSNERDDEGPFPVVIYTNAAAVSANQLYHTATLLMLQAKPNGVRIRGQRSIFWHARQVIGISVSNLLHAAWTNAPQPLYIAGKVMSSKAEHRVVLEALAEIERTTGFATQWRAQDLKEYWGDEAD
ncbi:hypothetical protein E4T47_09081 [Aureobasidium subglaciale]|nr:hypothetical protein E4T47_09081 [Aureobasidium subglaciale]